LNSAGKKMTNRKIVGEQGKVGWETEEGKKVKQKKEIGEKWRRIMNRIK
jgi:hypothetical protein